MLGSIRKVDAFQVSYALYLEALFLFWVVVQSSAVRAGVCRFRVQVVGHWNKAAYSFKPLAEIHRMIS